MDKRFLLVLSLVILAIVFAAGLFSGRHVARLERIADDSLLLRHTSDAFEASVMFSNLKEGNLGYLEESYQLEIDTHILMLHNLLDLSDNEDMKATARKMLRRFAQLRAEYPLDASSPALDDRLETIEGILSQYRGDPAAG